LGKNTNKSRDPKNSYLEINFNRLKAVAYNWSKRYPCIEQITFYPHNPESFGEGKKYLIDIILDERPVKNQIEIMETLISLNELLDAQHTDNSFEKKDWKIYFRFRGAVLPVHLILNIGIKARLFKKEKSKESISSIEFLRKFPVTQEPFKKIPERHEKRERTTWEKNIQPLVPYFCTSIIKNKKIMQPFSEGLQ